MSAEERDSQVMARLEPIIESIDTTENILSLFETMGIPVHSYAYFVLGIIYVHSQKIYREEFSLGVIQADLECLAFWQHNGTQIKEKVLSLKDNWLS